ncbi:MAG: citramalate synthase [Acidimicrobiia bacterium]|nr:citramalate synthase [Acidimicrobiia bacterium]NNF11088.1 citramalate synthase [Acidimicrobiia bacterium]NNL69036.1 citramalate synthase [Acidimicrobiia bacterium]
MVEIYDTTLRDGAQREGISLTVEEKLRIATLLDELGVQYIEGGWPGALPKDTEFFARAEKELDLENATLVAFGSTRRAGEAAAEDPQLQALLDANTEVICVVGKAWDYHVTEALQTTLDEALAMAADTISFLRSEGKRVFFDAEHFFDGYRHNPEFALAVVRTAGGAGAERVILCDTNGGGLPDSIAGAVAAVRRALPEADLGIHAHNDSGCAVANTLAAVDEGVVQVQGCINGYGERTGNADLCTVLPDLVLKRGIEAIPKERLTRLTTISHLIADLVNITLDAHHPYVGTSAFAHKAGLHTSAIARRTDAYEHINPSEVGNTARMVVSEMAGRSTVLGKAREQGLDLDDETAAAILATVKDLEAQGYQIEAADGTFELLVRRASGWEQPFFELESFRVFTERRLDGEVTAEATIKVHVKGERVVATSEGDGPVNALDRALRQALATAYPEVMHLRLTDYRVRVLDPSAGTAAVTRVLLEMSDGRRAWGTIGVHENIIEASWEAVADGVVVGLLRLT